MRDLLPRGVANPSVADGCDKSQPANSYSWQSHPMGASIDRTLDWRWVVSTVQGVGIIRLTFTAPDTEPVSEQMNLPPEAATGPVVLRKATEFTAATCTLRIEADSLDSTIPAPIVHQISLAYNEALPVEEAVS